MTTGNLSQRERPWLPAVLVLACVAIALVPLAIRGNSCGQDLDFHFESWMSVVHHWHQGVLYPHWIASANYGAGEPRFVFYPPLSWALGGLLCVLLPWNLAPFAFIFICLLAIAAACYRMAREWLPPATSALAACLYVTNPYILFVIYERSALAELFAAVWFPLLILYSLRRKSSLLQLALVVALLWLTDAPAAVMGSYALGVVVVVAALTQRSFALVARAAAAMVLGLGLTGFYLIPAIYEQRWVEITRALDTGLRIQDSFLFEHTGMAYHDMVLRSVSWIAVVMLAMTFIAIAILVALRSTRLHPLRQNGCPLLILAAVITLLLFPISLPIWHVLPKLRFLQFPWRCLLLLGLIAAVFAAEALVTLVPRIIPSPDSGPRKPPVGLSGVTTWSHDTLPIILSATAVLVLAAITATHASRRYWQLCDDQDNIRAQRAARNNTGFEGTDEYTPAPADNSNIQIGLPPVRVVASATADEADDDPADDSADQSSDDNDSGNPAWQPAPHVLLPAPITIHLWQDEHIVASIRSPQPAFAVFRLMSYPAWRIRINNTPGRSLPRRDDGLLAIPIPSGTSTIDIRYRTTPDVWAGRIVSLLALALWLALAAKICLRRGIIEQNASRTPAQ